MSKVVHANTYTQKSSEGVSTPANYSPSANARRRGDGLKWRVKRMETWTDDPSVVASLKVHVALAEVPWYSLGRAVRRKGFIICPLVPIPPLGRVFCPPLYVFKPLTYRITTEGHVFMIMLHLHACKLSYVPVASWL